MKSQHIFNKLNQLLLENFQRMDEQVFIEVFLFCSKF